MNRREIDISTLGVRELVALLAGPMVTVLAGPYKEQVGTVHRNLLERLSGFAATDLTNHLENPNYVENTLVLVADWPGTVKQFLNVMYGKPPGAFVSISPPPPYYHAGYEEMSPVQQPNSLCEQLAALVLFADRLLYDGRDLDKFISEILLAELANPSARLTEELMVAVFRTVVYSEKTSEILGKFAGKQMAIRTRALKRGEEQTFDFEEAYHRVPDIGRSRV